MEWRPDTWNNTGIVYGCKSDGDVTRRCVDGFFFFFSFVSGCEMTIRPI